MALPVLLLTDDGRLASAWPFVEGELRRLAAGAFEVRRMEVTPAQEKLDLAGVAALALFGGEPSIACLDRGELRVAGAATDRCGIRGMRWFWDRDVPFVEATGGWAQSVAELAIGLLISALRRIPHWHAELRRGRSDWTYDYAQFCDDPRFVNGTIAGKRVGVIGLGAIGGRIARFCRALGAEVRAYDPFVADQRFMDCDAGRSTVDDLVDWSDVLAVAVPPTPSAVGVIDAARVDRLRRGAIVLTVTRAAPVDCVALRRRVIGGELLWASDVFDREPLPADDPLLSLDNVVLTPHIAGRTRDANLAVARILVDGFRAALAGEPVPHRLSPEQVRIRLGAQSLAEIGAPTHR